MAKGASTAIVMILVMLITISLILMSYQWLLKYSPQTQQELEKNLLQKNGCLKIESIDTINKKITVRNCGDSELSNFFIYIDDKQVGSYPNTLGPGGIIQISYTGYITPGVNHNIMVSSDYAESPVITFLRKCDIYIYQYMIPYPISQSNLYYCLAENVHIDNKNAINFSLGVQNSILDCKGYNVDGNDASGTSGVYLAGNNNNNIISNCYITDFDNGINIFSSSGNVITNTNANSNGEGIVITSSSNNIITNFIANNSIEEGIEVLANSNNNIITNSTVYNSTGSGIHLDTSSNNNIQNNAITTLVSNSNGIYLESSNNFNVISNNIINTLQTYARGIELDSSNNYNILSNNIIAASASYGIYLTSSSNNTVYNNMITAGGSSCVYLGSSSNSNNLSSNVIYMNTSNYGIWLDSVNNNIITGGSISSLGYDYYLSSANTTNNFTNTNFTASRKIYFNDSTSWFNYRDDSSQSIWLKTNVSAKSTITRKLINWDNTLMQWNDTFSNTSGSIIANYNITGLLINANYSVYNNSIVIPGSPFNSSSNGQINFTISLPAGQEHEIKVQALYAISPLWFSNSTNNTVAGQPTLFSLNWTDDAGLSGYIFSFNNGSSKNFGVTTVLSNNWTNTAGALVGNRFLAPEDGTLQSINLYVVDGGSGSIRVGIYSDSSGPNVLLGQSNPETVNNWQWHSFSSGSIPGVKLTGGSYYWLAFEGQNNIVTRWDNGASNQEAYEYNGWNPLPNPFNTSNFCIVYPSYCLPYVYSVFANYTTFVNDTWNNFKEDFTTYTKVCPNNHINITAYHLDFAGTHYENCYLYADKGVNHFTDWTHLIDAKLISESVGDRFAGFYALANDINDLGGIEQNNNTSISLRFYNSAVYLHETYGGSSYETSHSVSVGTQYYVKIVKSGTSIWVGFYSDAARTNLLFNLSLTLHANHQFRYIYAANNWNNYLGPPAGQSNVSIDNLLLQEPVAWSNVTKTLNPTSETLVQWCVYANDTGNNWNYTSCINPFSLITTGASCNYPSSGNWNINTNVVCSDQLITINGNITIQNGGNLTLRNVTLIFNNSFDLQNGIYTQSGGGLFISDKDSTKETTNDASNLTVTNSNYHFFFLNYAGSKISINNSFMSNMGSGSGGCTGDWTGCTGLNIYGDNATVINNTFNNTYRAISMHGSTGALALGNTINNTADYGVLITCYYCSNSQNNNVTGNTIINSNTGIHFCNGAKNNTAYGNNIFGGSYGIYLHNGGGGAPTYNSFYNNNITSATYGIYLTEETYNNTFENISISNSGTSDFYLSNQTATDTFRNTSFWATRTIYFNDANATFNYNNNTGNIWLKTNVSSQATISRKIISWSQTLMQWNDTSSSLTTARYNITGLSTNTNYNVYNNTIAISGSPFNSGSNGQISFTINLPINYQCNITVKT